MAVSYSPIGRGAVSFGLLVASLLSLAEAEAADQKSFDHSVAVLAVFTGTQQSRLRVSEVIDAVARAARFRKALRVLNPEQMYAAQDAGLAQKVRDCGPVDACIASRMRYFDARMGLVVIVDSSLNPPLLNLRLLDTDSGKLLADKIVEAQAGRELPAQVSNYAGELFDVSGHPKIGRLLVTPSPGKTKISFVGVGPQPKPGQLRFELSPGQYQIKAQAEDYLPQTHQVNVLLGQEQHLELTLEQEQVWWKSPWFWGISGATLVAGAVTSAVLLSQDQSPCVCLTHNGKGCEICSN